MVQQTTRVPFTPEIVGMCLCPGCPVQGASQCAISRELQIKQALTKKPLKKEEIPAAYCAAGQPSCTDLDTARPCQCPKCKVFAEYQLIMGTPATYYCRDGKAK